MREYCLNKVKKLSPSEPVVTIEIVIELPRNYPFTKLEKLIRLKYDFVTKAKPSVVRSFSTTELSRYSDLMSKLCDLIYELKRENIDTTVCVNYRVVVYNTDCLCRERPIYYTSIGKRTFCIERVNDQYIHIYCNREKKYVTIKYFVQKPVSTPDPVQLTASIFTYCNSLDKTLDYLLNKVKYNLELVRKYISK